MKNKGFTLIEVLIALSIVAVTLAAGIKSTAALTNTSARLDDMVLAKLCLSNEFIRLRLLKQLPPIGHTTHTCIQGNVSYEMEVDVQSTPNNLFRKIEGTLLKDKQPILKLYNLMGTY